MPRVYTYLNAHQLTSVDAPRPSDVAHYRYAAAGNPVDRAELGFPVTNSFNNLNQIVSGVWTGSTLTVAGAVNYPTGSIAVNGIGGTIYPDGSFAVTNVPVSLGTNSLTAVYNGPAYTNAPMTATDTVSVVLANSSYTHDANGNLTSDATFLYQYDTANQLTNVVRKADNVRVLSCRYDALGRRVEAIRADGTVDRYVYFPGSFLVLAVLAENNACKEFYTRGPDLSGTLDAAGGIGGILACTYANTPTAPLFHHADIQGNVILGSDNTCSIVFAFRYTPFGQLISCLGNCFSRYHVFSKEDDSEIGLVYYGYRYYHAKSHRWMTRDSIPEQWELSRYGYLGNNTSFWIDPDGLLKTAMQSWVAQAFTRPFVTWAIAGFVGQAIPKNDPGRDLAMELMNYYVFGKGPYISSARRWGKMMREQPELKRRLYDFFEKKSLEICAGSQEQGDIKEIFTDIALQTYDSMVLTLNGCHKVIVEGVFRAKKLQSCCCKVKYKRITFTWVDEGDLHPKTISNLKSGDYPDDLFIAVGNQFGKVFPTVGPFQIEISWTDSSQWLVNTPERMATRQKGWP